MALLAAVMQWRDSSVVSQVVSQNVQLLQLLAAYKYDSYQRFAPGKRFIESLALWLKQFDQADRQTALDFVMKRLVNRPGF